jgi:hypothetical protein
MNKGKLWLGRILLAFVFVTIGFSLGRGTAPAGSPVAVSHGAGDKVVVYAAHASSRCLNCNLIEWLTKELIDEEFADQLADGRLEFHSVDYLKDSAFASRYNISASTIVVASMNDGEPVKFERLDEVWTKLRDHDAFRSYIREVIRKQIEAIAGGA